jgi:hypothetical protein
MGFLACSGVTGAILGYHSAARRKLLCAAAHGNEEDPDGTRDSCCT